MAGFLLSVNGRAIRLGYAGDELVRRSLGEFLAQSVGPSSPSNSRRPRTPGRRGAMHGGDLGRGGAHLSTATCCVPGPVGRLRAGHAQDSPTSRALGRAAAGEAEARPSVAPSSARPTRTRSHNSDRNKSRGIS